MSRYVLAAAVFILGCTHPGPTKHTGKDQPKTGPDSNTLFISDSAYSSITLQRDTVNGYPEIEEWSRTQSYHFISYLEYDRGGMGVMHALVKELSIQHKRDAPQGLSEGKIFLNGYISNSNPIRTTHDFYDNTWTDSMEANEVYYRTAFIETVLRRDDGPSVRKLIDYAGGKILMQLSSELHGLQEPGGYDRRWIGYLERPHLLDEEKFDTIPGIYGLLSYVSPIDNRVQYLVLQAEEDAGRDNLWEHESFDQISVEGVRKNPKDEEFRMDNGVLEQWAYSDFKKFTILLHFKGARDITIRVPVRNDGIDIHNLRSEDFIFYLK